MKAGYFICFVSLFLLFGCDSDDKVPWVVICPSNNTMVQVLTVDYTTNKFLGGYAIELPHYLDTLELDCKYNSPVDFGDITWFEKKTETELFTGTIIWMGKGERSFPEEINNASSFVKLDKVTEMPTFYPLFHDEYSKMDTNEEFDYTPIWQSIEKLQFISWMEPSTPAYIYLYCPSVGVGDPADWYWLIFTKY